MVGMKRFKDRSKIKTKNKFHWQLLMQNYNQELIPFAASEVLFLELGC